MVYIMNEFKEEYIFEIYKDKYLGGSKNFIKEIKDNFNLTVTDDLYKKIINYQVKKYGRQLDYGGHIEYIPKNKNRNRKRRLRDVENAKDSEDYKKFLERNDY